jgi:hypothetical protein
MKQTDNQPPRRYVAYTSVLGTTQLHLRSPFIIALWSLTFPGSGHLLLSKCIRGFLLIIWEVFINFKARINLLILYSFIGDFEKAKSVVDIQWMMLYIPTYIFAIWDSYRTTVDLNHQYILAAREDAEINPFKITSLGINHLDKRIPWASAAWSIFVPGSGQLYIHRLATAFFIMIWWTAVVYLSKLLPSFHYTFLGDFQQAKAVINMQWFLNIPSIYFFAIYDAYINTVENNKLYEWEQSKFLKKNYQDRNFKILDVNNAGDSMYIVSTFEHSTYLELAITAIQMKGIKKEDIFAVPMVKKTEDGSLFDSIHGADGLSLLDIPSILAVFFGIFGSIYGFVIEWGPLFGGLIGISIGTLLGFIIKFFTTKKFKNKNRNLKGTEVVLIIGCTENQSDMLKNILWAHHAFGVSKLDMN